MKDQMQRNSSKSWKLSVVLLALCANSLFAQADKQFRQMVVTYWQNWSTMDPAKCESMYVKDSDAVFFDVAPMQYKGWAEYAEGAKKVFATTARADIRPDEGITVHKSGNLAWTTDTFHGVLTGKDGKTSELKGRHTLIWQKIGGKWLIVHDHVSVPIAE